MIKQTLYWHKPADSLPSSTQTILVQYDRLVWPAVYSNGDVHLYPEDYGKIKLSECELWASIPGATLAVFDHEPAT